ncbi:hypothetical protein [Streptomyces sp. NPDC056105]|uniref:hypothetical protein n=1 Tax=Streptomyces sp. NPDC056105 TaxID=3345714 RepID=UPI0035DD410C
MPTDRPPLSPCRRNDRHDEHVYEVYGRPFQCCGYTPRTEAELLAELAPLAAVIADKLRTVPVRHCPGGTDDLISELTIAAAAYCGKHVLPAGPPPAPVGQAAIARARAEGEFEALCSAAEHMRIGVATGPIPLETRDAVAAWLRGMAERRQVRALKRAAEDGQADEEHQAHAFVPDAPRAPGLCATCGDSRAWHQAAETQQQDGSEQ